MTKLPLTKRKRERFRNKDATLRGQRLAYNAAQRQKYVNALERLVEQMTEATKKQVSRLFHGEIADDYFEQQEAASAMDASLASKARKLMNALTRTFTQLFSKKSVLFAERMVNGAAQASKTNLHGSLKQLSGGLSLKTGVVPKGMEDIARALIAENVSLIKSIPQEYFKNVTGAVMRSITTGNGLADLVPEIKKYQGQSDRRAKNLAIDQTRKAYNSINKARMQAIGVRQFEWVHSGGGQKPRESHMKISGHIFDFENLEAQQAALGVPKADQGIPGYPVNCGCTMIPVIRFEGED
jgi:SPP1 gp7 family putative phage head morphogenesis protein